MPTLKKLLKPNQPTHRSDKTKECHKCYNTTTWRKLREAYLMEHPICECCNKEWATQVHHKYEISKGENELEMLSIAFDPGNLLALCLKCHSEIHKNRHRDEKLNRKLGN